jgi:hypothetical protein
MITLVNNSSFFIYGNFASKEHSQHLNFEIVDNLYTDMSNVMVLYDIVHPHAVVSLSVTAKQRSRLR